MGEQVLEAAQRWQQTCKNILSKQAASPVGHLWSETSTNVTLFHPKVITTDTQAFTSTVQLCPILPLKHTDAGVHFLTKMLSTGANHRAPMPTRASLPTVHLSESYKNKLPELFSLMKRKREEGQISHYWENYAFLLILGNYKF